MLLHRLSSETKHTKESTLKFMKGSFSCTWIAKENNWLVNARRPHGTIKPVNTTEPKSLLQGTDILKFRPDISDSH